MSIIDDDKSCRVTDFAYTAVTHQVQVKVEPFYLEDESKPEEHTYVWAYRVRITNSGPRAVQLLGRTWIITDGCGRTIEVEGAGVVGEQPLLEPGDTFEYTSGTPLDTSTGFMRGTYHMVAVATGEQLDVEIPAFSLDSPGGSKRLH